MATRSTSTAVAAVSVFTEPEQLALAGFVAGYTGLTHEAYALDQVRIRLVHGFVHWPRRGGLNEETEFVLQPVRVTVGRRGSVAQHAK